MKRIVFVRRAVLLMAVILMASITMTAQEKELSRIRHIDRSLLMTKGDSLTIVNLYLEWPEVIMGFAMPALQEFLCRELFESDSMPLDKCIRQLTERYGTPISQMPEKENINVKYKNITLLLLAYEPLRYISGRVSVTERDNKSASAKETRNALFTYDFRKDKILRTADLIKKNYTPHRYSHYEWVDLIEKLMPRMDYKVLDVHLPDEVCLLNRTVGMVANIPNDDAHTFGELCYIPMGIAKRFLKSNILRFIDEKIEQLPKKKMVARRTSAVSTEVFELNDNTPDSLRIYPMVDKQPEFKGGKQKIAEYFAGNLSYPEYEQSLKIEGQLLVRFVVRSDGSVADPEVLLPISPGIDRVGVQAIMAMPRWIPAQFKGKDVNCRVILPISFKINN